MRTPIIILLFVILLAASCGEPPMPPSDEEMIRHFTTHEVAFRKVYEIMAESSEGSFHYPPLSPEEVIILDSMEQSDTSHETNDEQDIPVYGLLKPERILLDSLLSEIGCGFILVDRREWGTADSVYVSLVMPYYSHGIVDAGTSKWRFRSKGPQKTDDYFGVKPPKKDSIINKKGRELGSRASIFRSIATQLS